MEKRDEFIVPEEMAEWIGLKKSQYLSDLICHSGPDDIGFEKFHEYDHLIPGTIERPDRMFERMEDKQRLRVYTRVYTEGFHQVVIGVLIPDKQSGDLVYVPILNFVSKNQDLVRMFCKGEELLRPTFN